MSRDTDWIRLDATRARYGAQWGRYMAGVTLLELSSGSVVICGAMTCGNRGSAERHAESYRGDRRDIDGGRVSRATLESWAAK